MTGECGAIYAIAQLVGLQVFEAAIVCRLTDDHDGAHVGRLPTGEPIAFPNYVERKR